MRSALITADDMPGDGWSRASEESLALNSGFFEWTPKDCDAILDDLTGAILTSPGATKVVTGFERGTGKDAEQATQTLVQTSSPVDIAVLSEKIGTLIDACPQLTSLPTGQADSFSVPIVVTLSQSDVPAMGDGSTGVNIQLKADTVTVVLDIMVIVQGNHLISIRTAGVSPQPELQAQLGQRALDKLDVVVADSAG